MWDGAFLFQCNLVQADLSPPRLSGSSLTAIFQGCVPILQLNNFWERDVVFTMVVTIVMLPLQAWVTSLGVGNSSGAQSPPSWVHPWESLSDLSRPAFMPPSMLPGILHWETNDTKTWLCWDNTLDWIRTTRAWLGPFLSPFLFPDHTPGLSLGSLTARELLSPTVFPGTGVTKVLAQNLAQHCFLLVANVNAIPYSSRFKRRGHSLHF